jgi:RimJ/RimL family protein N-acetyltransferase
MNVLPEEIATARLYLRPWRKQDAALLLPVLVANAAHLGPWIPAHVAAPAPLAELEVRLAGFGADFEAALAWRFGIFSPDQRHVYGEADLFFRSAEGRVPLAAADRTEIGYWLRQDVTGRGFATEAAGALMQLAARLPGMKHIEIRCDPRNQPSAAVPRRLGFRLAQAGTTGVAEAAGPSDGQPGTIAAAATSGASGERPGSGEAAAATSATDDDMIWRYEIHHDH